MTDLHGVSGVEQLQSADTTAAKNKDWIYHATDAKLALLITMHDETECVAHTIQRVRQRMGWIGIIRSFSGEGEPFKFLADNKLEVEYAGTLPDLGGTLSRFELPAVTLCRNFSALFSAAAIIPDIDYYVAITGDTVLLHPYGIEEIVAAMEKADAAVGCSKACGQEFHRANWTLEELEAGKGGGRKQGLKVPDFQPQLWVTRRDALYGFVGLEPVNLWCSEECLGVAAEAAKAKQYVFSETAYNFGDGVLYHAVTNQPGGES